MLKTTKSLHLISLCGLILTACGGGSGGGNTVVQPVRDTIRPTVSFSPTTLTVEAEQTATSNLTSNDNVGVTTGPTVSCTNGGTYSGSTFTAPMSTTEITSICTATVGDAAGNSSSATLTVTVTPPNVPPTASISVSDMSPNEGLKTTLDASGSSDENGDPLTYSWTQLSGPNLNFSAPTGITTDVAVPNLTEDTSARVQLQVSDGEDTTTEEVTLDKEYY